MTQLGISLHVKRDKLQASLNLLTPWAKKQIKPIVWARDRNQSGLQVTPIKAQLKKTGLSAPAPATQIATTTARSLQRRGAVLCQRSSGSNWMGPCSLGSGTGAHALPFVRVSGPACGYKSSEKIILPYPSYNSYQDPKVSFCPFLHSAVLFLIQL
jgi:hypothetical protein